MPHIALETGNRVLVRNLAPRQAPHKPNFVWEDKLHVAVNRKDEGPVYVVKPENGTGREPTLHRNPLPCCMLINTDAEEKSQNRKRCIRAPKQRY